MEEADTPKKKKQRIEVQEQIEEEQNDNINSKLPEELLLYLFCFFPRFPPLLTLCLVCKYWNTTISKPSILWGGSHIYDGGISMHRFNIS